MKLKAGDIIHCGISYSNMMYSKYAPSAETLTLAPRLKVFLTVVSVKKYASSAQNAMTVYTIEEGEIIFLEFSWFEKIK